MYFFKIMQDDEIIAAEAFEKPVFICRQAKNNILIRCPEVHGCGILSLDCSTIYQLYNKPSLNLDNNYIAYPIVMTEYEEILRNLEPIDPEDENPEILNNLEGEAIGEPLTRAELTSEINALKLQNELLENQISELTAIISANNEN